MRAMASQITGVSIIYSTVCSGVDQRKHQSSASLAFVRGIHRSAVYSPHKGPVTRIMFPFNDVITRSIKNCDQPYCFVHSRLDFTASSYWGLAVHIHANDLAYPASSHYTNHAVLLSNYNQDAHILFPWDSVENIVCKVSAIWFRSARVDIMWIKQGLHRIVTNLGPIYELNNSGFLYFYCQIAS